MGGQEDERTRRLHCLLDWALTYREWTQARLARELGIHPSNLFRGGWDRAASYYVGLAKALGFSVEDVVAHVKSGTELTSETVGAGHDFESLDDRALEAFRKGEFARVLEQAETAFAAATTPEQRALAYNRLHGAWDGLGQYPRALKAAQHGLREPGISTSLRMMLQANLANTYYTLWGLPEALGIARTVIEWFHEHPPSGRRDCGSEAFAYFSRGHAYRRMLSQHLVNRREYALHAKADLEASAEIFSRIVEGDDDYAAGIVHIIRGGIVEAEVALGVRDPRMTIEDVVAALEAVSDPTSWPVGTQLESHGWWCVFGLNILLRHFEPEWKDFNRWFAVLTNKALEIAGRLGNWALRERILTLEHHRRNAVARATAIWIAPVLDGEDVRCVIGVMARFPGFREVGQKILKDAKIVLN